MKSKKNLLILSLLLIHLTAFSQQIGDGLAPIISDFTTPLKSGTYNGYNPTGAIPDYSSGWQHLFVLRHPNINNNYQLQLASSIESNDRFFFRKIAWGTPISQNPVWHEMATRGVNTFVGTQTVSNGVINIDTSIDNVMIFSNPTTNTWQYFSFYTGATRKTWMGLDPNNNFNISKENGGNILLNGGNIGIGNPTPEYKLDINTPATATEAYSGINLQSANFGYLIEGGLKQNAGGILKVSLNTAGVKSEKFRIDQNGQVGIGTTNPDQKLTVKGKIHAEEIIVDLTVPADYVFQKFYTGKSELKADYVMPTLAEIENFTKKNHHLPNVPSAKEIQQNGLSLGEMSNVLLQKVEELTLYVIEQQNELVRLRTENANYKSLAERLSAIEKELKK